MWQGLSPLPDRIWGVLGSLFLSLFVPDVCFRRAWAVCSKKAPPGLFCFTLRWGLELGNL